LSTAARSLTTWVRWNNLPILNMIASVRAVVVIAL
jgi:hypothetical protein